MTILSLIGLSSIENKLRPGHGITINLLRMKFSVASFLSSVWGVDAHAPSIKKDSLFPAIAREKLVDFTNTYRGFAKACAADDFDLSLNAENGQVEVFDSYPNPDFQLFNPIHIPNGDFKNTSDGHFHNGIGAFGPSLRQAQFISSYDNTDLSGSSHHSSQSYYKEEEEMNFHLANHNPFFNKPQYLNNFVSRDIASDHQSHFAINAYGINTNPTFTDFTAQSFNDCSSYGSSFGSFDSPLDDLLFPGPSIQAEMPLMQAPEPRKRKASQPTFENHADLQKDTTSSKRLKYESSMFLGDTAESNSAPNEVRNDLESENKDRFACKDCNASFKVKSYLTRHMKKHTNSKAFVCPFFNNNINNSDAIGSEMANKCHPNGGFSRKDTYTTHMKALHFVYPPRTKSSQRNMSGGRCTGCFEYFDNNASWLKNHIEAYLCPGLSDSSDRESARVKQENSD